MNRYSLEVDTGTKESSGFPPALLALPAVLLLRAAPFQLFQDDYRGALIQDRGAPENCHPQQLHAAKVANEYLALFFASLGRADIAVLWPAPFLVNVKAAAMLMPARCRSCYAIAPAAAAFVAAAESPSAPTPQIDDCQRPREPVSAPPHSVLLSQVRQQQQLHGRPRRVRHRTRPGF